MLNQRAVENCRKKKVYNSYIQATIKAHYINEKFPESKQGPYKCNVCGKYHLSRQCSNKMNPCHIKFPASWGFQS